MGRNKIRIEKIKSNRNRNVTFNKRKKGLIKKAMELALLCDVEIFVTIVNNSGNTLSIFSSHRNPDAFCETYLKRPITATDVCSLNEYSTINFDKTKEESKSISTETKDNEKEKEKERDKDRDQDKAGQMVKEKEMDRDKGSQLDPYLNTSISFSSLNQNQGVKPNNPMDNHQMLNNMYLNQHSQQNQSYYSNDTSSVYREPSHSTMYSDSDIFNRSNYQKALNYLASFQPQEPKSINNNIYNYANLIDYFVKSSYVRSSNELSKHLIPNNRYI